MQLRQMAFSCETATQYLYSRPLVLALLEGYFHGLGDIEQRADLVGALKRMRKDYASVLVADSLGLGTGETARRLGIVPSTVWRRRQKAIDVLVNLMNGENA